MEPHIRDITAAAVRERALRHCCREHDWRRAAKVLPYARRDWQVLGYESWRHYLESIGWTRDHGRRLLVIGLAWWQGEPFRSTIAETLPRARRRIAA